LAKFRFQRMAWDEPQCAALAFPTISPAASMPKATDSFRTLPGIGAFFAVLVRIARDSLGPVRVLLDEQLPVAQARVQHTAFPGPACDVCRALRGQGDMGFPFSPSMLNLIGTVIGATGNNIVRYGMRAAYELSACLDNPDHDRYLERAGRVWVTPETNFDEAIAAVRACGAQVR